MSKFWVQSLPTNEAAHQCQFEVIQLRVKQTLWLPSYRFPLRQIRLRRLEVKASRNPALGLIRPSNKGCKSKDVGVRRCVPLDDTQHPGLHAADNSLEDIPVFGDILDAKQLIKSVVVVSCFGCLEAECVGWYLANCGASTPQGCSGKHLRSRL